MTFAVERLNWRFDAYRRLFQACAHGGVSPLRFLTVRPDRLRIRFGESARQTQVPIVFAPLLSCPRISPIPMVQKPGPR